MNSVVHFEIPLSDLEKAKKFYGDVFGWQFSSWDDNYVMTRTTESDKDGMPKMPGAINGGIQKRGDRAKGPTFVMSVDDIDSKLDEIEKAGGKVVFPKEMIGEMGYYAQFEDPEGNRLGVFQPIMKS